MAKTPPDLTFIVAGTPVPKQSYRHSKNGGYQPARVTGWQDTIGWRASLECQLSEPHVGRVRMALVFRMPTRRRVDLDNLSKAVCDALEGVVYANDTQVYELHLTKWLRSKQPGVEISLWLEGDQEPTEPPF